MAVTITKTGGNLTQVIDDNFTISFSGSTNTPIYDDSDPPIRIGTATMTSMTLTVSNNVVNSSNTSISNGTSTCQISGRYRQVEFPGSSMTYVLKSQKGQPGTTITNFDMDNIPIDPSTIELLAIKGADINTKDITLTVRGRDSEGVTKTNTYTLTLENNLGKVKNYIKQVYP